MDNEQLMIELNDLRAAVMANTLLLDALVAAYPEPQWLMARFMSQTTETIAAMRKHQNQPSGQKLADAIDTHRMHMLNNFSWRPLDTPPKKR